jgi:hypothetical protein
MTAFAQLQLFDGMCSSRVDLSDVARGNGGYALARDIQRSSTHLPSYDLNAVYLHAEERVLINKSHQQKRTHDATGRAC